MGGVRRGREQGGVREPELVDVVGQRRRDLAVGEALGGPLEPPRRGVDLVDRDRLDGDGCKWFGESGFWSA